MTIPNSLVTSRDPFVMLALTKGWANFVSLFPLYAITRTARDVSRSRAQCASRLGYQRAGSPEEI
jgi:hypothetical protein